MPAFLALNLAFLDGALAAPPMWNVRIVSCVPGSPMLWAAMMPTAMPSSTIEPVDKVHAVAQPADAQRGVAGHRAADLDLFQAQLLDPAGDVGRDQLVFADDHFVGDRVDDVRAG